MSSRGAKAIAPFQFAFDGFADEVKTRFTLGQRGIDARQHTISERQGDPVRKFHLASHASGYRGFQHFWSSPLFFVSTLLTIAYVRYRVKTSKGRQQMTNEFRTAYIALTKAAKAATKAYNAVPHTDALEQDMLASYDAIGALLEANGLAFHQTGKKFHLKGEAL